MAIRGRVLTASMFVFLFVYNLWWYYLIKFIRTDWLSLTEKRVKPSSLLLTKKIFIPFFLFSFFVCFFRMCFCGKEKRAVRSLEWVSKVSRRHSQLSVTWTCTHTLTNILQLLSRIILYTYPTSNWILPANETIWD